MTTPHLVIVEDAAALAHAAQRMFVSAAERAIVSRRTFSVALAGGATPKALYQLLAKGPPTQEGRFEPPSWPFDWEQVEFFFSDERCVPPDDPQSNFAMAYDAMLGRLPIPATSIHRMPGEMPPEEAAKEYGLLLQQKFGDGGLDLVLLGMGEDGHTASLFPHTTVLDETKHRCIAHYVEKSTTGRSWRLTLTAPFINKAREIVIMVSGAAKAARVAEVLEGPRDPMRLPVQLIQPVTGRLIWLLDRAAASQLSGGMATAAGVEPSQA